MDGPFEGIETANGGDKATVAVDDRIVGDEGSRQKARPGDESDVERLIDIADSLDPAVLKPIVLRDLIGLAGRPHVGPMVEAGRPGCPLVKWQAVKAQPERRLER